jgi:hypothetical protein
MKIELEFPISPDEFAEAMEAAGRGNARPLRDLCQKERERFETVVRQHPHYSDGLVTVERLAVEGYLYQKLRGHLDAAPEVSNLPPER